ncbi:hypothetical protein BB560_001542 [Smittium megazygosporum]|uniref:Leucine carboxyl methyltransferase 1 n=1 Tax=Smittium megazygosporum TaxID=133381 RepID=A0A2T9ZHH8_9FUNG|nr:hypothetical protein BB560_001542 [Smittium megazygosporum]
MVDPQEQGEESFSMSNDVNVQNTSRIAAASRLSAIKKNYINDEYTKYFVKRHTRLSPVMNRGTYIRFTGIQSVLKKFIEISNSLPSDFSRGQIISLGSGLDTSYFLNADELYKFKFFEVDFPAVNKIKISTILSTPELAGKFPVPPVVDEINWTFDSPNYSIISGDLCEFDCKITNILSKFGFDTSLPTLVIAECVLVYMPAQYSSNVISWLQDRIENLVFICYEQINPHDRFGKMMVANLKDQGIHLKGLDEIALLQDQENRFSVSAGFNYSKALDLWSFYQSCISEQEKAKISKLEFLDEFEELKILLQHYCFTLAYKCSSEYSHLFQKIEFIKSS